MNGVQRLFAVIFFLPALASASDFSEVLAVPSVKELLGSSPAQSLQFTEKTHAPRVETSKYQHFYNGIEVLGSMTMRHLGPNGVQISDKLARFDLNTSTNLTPAEATELAMSDSGDEDLRGEPELKILPALSGEGSARLVFFVPLRKQIIVDAQSGEIVARISDEETLAPINVYSAQGTGKLIPETSFNKLKKKEKTSFLASQCQVIDQTTGNPFFLSPSDCHPGGTDPSAQRATDFAQTVLSYYQTTFNRNGYDGNGAPITAVVHTGFKYDNALWNTQTNLIAYGDGDGVMFGDFTEALDVTGHEITHGITAATAKLLMLGESGSINEAFSDFFGRMIANDGLWSIGKKLFIDPNAKGLRDLANPSSLTYSTQDAQGKVTHSGAYPAQLSQMAALNSGEKCDLQANDNCFVHINSTVMSHASYLVYQAIGKEKAEELYFTTLTQKLTATSTLRSAAQSVVDACGLLFDSPTCTSVSQAYMSVGLVTKTPLAVSKTN